MLYTHCSVHVLQYDEQEVYTVKELLRDVQSCSASRVVIVADQSFSGEVARNAARMQIAEGKLSNVGVVASSQEAEWAFSYEFSKHWMHANHQHMCLQQIQEVKALFIIQQNILLFNKYYTECPMGR